MSEMIKPYNIENVNNALVSLDKLIELDIKRHEKIIELKYSLIRIQRASKKEFWLDEELKNEIKKVELEIRKEIPNGKPSMHNQYIRAKINIIKREKQLMNLKDNKRPAWEDPFFRWDDFKFHKKKQYENDREKYIKEGLIE